MSPNDTIEDRLRGALTDVAESTRLSPDAWEQVERRARRRRLPPAVMAVAAAITVAAIATAAVLLVDRDDEGPEIATTEDRASECGVAAPADVAVTLELGASDAEVRAIEQLLAQESAVTDYTFQSGEEGARIFRCVFADQPETLAGADLSRVPSLFLVDLASRADIGAFIEEVETRPFAAASPGNCYRWADAEVYMLVGASPEQITAARAAIEQNAGVADVVFVSKEDAYREFACRLVGDPEQLAGITPDSLPTSFRVTLAPGAGLAELRALLELAEGLEGVETALDTRYSVVVPIPGFEGDEIGPSSTGYTEVASGVAGDGSAWQLLIRTGENSAYSALAEFPDSEVILDGVDGEMGWDASATGAGGAATIASFRPEVARVRIESGGMVSEVETVGAPGLRTRFLVDRLPVDQEVTLVALDADGDELYRRTLERSSP